MSTLRINKRAYEPWFAIGAIVVLRPRRANVRVMEARRREDPLRPRYSELFEMLPQRGIEQRLQRFIVD